MKYLLPASFDRFWQALSLSLLFKMSSVKEAREKKMAEKMDPKKSELSDRLKKEFNEHLQHVMEKNKDYKYGDVLTSENVEEVSSFNLF